MITLLARLAVVIWVIVMIVDLSQTVPIKVYGWKVGTLRMAEEYCRILTVQEAPLTLKEIRQGKRPAPSNCDGIAPDALGN